MRLRVCFRCSQTYLGEIERKCLIAGHETTIEKNDREELRVCQYDQIEQAIMSLILKVS